MLTDRDLIDSEVSLDESTTLTGMVDDTPFLSMAKFSEAIEEIVLKERISYLDAVLFFCSENSVEVEDVAPFVSMLLKQKIEQDAIEVGLLPRKSVLPDYD